MKNCQDMDLLLSLRAAGALDPDDAARLEAHLASCEACRGEADARAEALLLAKLPPPSQAERHATASLAKDTLARLRRDEHRAAGLKRFGVGFAAAAALALVVLAPAMIGKKPVPPQDSVAANSAASDSADDTWQTPDIDTLWSEADVLDVSNGSSSTSYDVGDAAMAAVDF
jgi:anti-sigma factor RsiW